MSVTIFQFFSRGPIAPQATTSGRTSGSLTGARQSAERPLSSTAAREALTGDLRPAGARLQPKLVLVGSSRTVRRSGATSGEAKGAAVGGLALPPAAPQALAGVSSSRSECTTQVGASRFQPLRSATYALALRSHSYALAFSRVLRQARTPTGCFALGDQCPPESTSGSRRVHVRCSSRASTVLTFPVSFSQTDLRSPSTF